VSRIERVATALQDRYAVRRELGRGGTATVYLADDLKLGRQVALKVFRPELAAAIGSARFLQEIAVTAKLNHPHILPLLDSGEGDGLLYYSMPFVAGESLRSRMSRERLLPVDEAVRIAMELSDALGFAHAHGVIHRDIKPENVLLADGHAVVADFGIAKAITSAGVEPLTETGIAIGTPAYMSPEQSSASTELDGRSDLYSLGCVLYEMLAGEQVFAGATPQTVMARHQKERIPDIRITRPQVGDALAGVLAKTLAKVPADRFASAEEFRTALAGATKDRRVRKPRPLARTALVGLASAAAVVGVWWAWRPPPRGPATPDAASVVSILDPNRIAVLYFEDLSADGSLGHVARGLTEDLIGQLSSVRALAVTSPEGVKPYRSSPVSVDSIARALSVGSIIGGSVQMSGGQLRVRVHLLDAATSKELFNQPFQDRFDELFALQDRVADEVARALRRYLGREIELRRRRAGTASRPAWELVYRGEELADEASGLVRSGRLAAAPTILFAADSLLAESERLDTAWAEPALVRARVAFTQSFVSSAPPDSAEQPDGDVPASLLSRAWLERAITHADRALRLEPRSADALALRGDLRYRLATWTAPAWNDSLVLLAESDLRTALEIRPGLARAWYSLGELHYRADRFQEASVALGEAYSSDAYLTETRDIVQLLFYGSLEIEQFENARRWCETGLRRFPDDPRFMDCEITLLGWSGRGQQHIAAARAALADVERRDTLRALGSKRAHERMWLAALYARTGMRAEALAYIDSARTLVRSDSLVSDAPHIEAYVRLLLGQRSQSLQLLSVVLEARPAMRHYLARSPWFKSVRSDPAFAAILRSGS